MQFYTSLEKVLLAHGHHWDGGWRYDDHYYNYDRRYERSPRQYDDSERFYRSRRHHSQHWSFHC